MTNNNLCECIENNEFKLDKRFQHGYDQIEHKQESCDKFCIEIFEYIYLVDVLEVTLIVKLLPIILTPTTRKSYVI